MRDIKRPRYSTWIRNYRIFLFWSLTFFIIFFAVIAGLVWKPLNVLAFASIPFAYIASIISLAKYRFSSKGGNFQSKIHDVIKNAIAREGNILDIGCGNGSLIIKLSMTNKYENIGIDYWGKEWEYSKMRCENNAELENVRNIKFLQASASNLPFLENEFDNVVSCLTFHEVNDTNDKTKAIREAIRVLKNGGTFTFLDLFNDTRYFPSFADNVKNILSAEGEIAIEKELSDIIKLPFPLMGKRILKYAVLIVGRKNKN